MGLPDQRTSSPSGATRPVAASHRSRRGSGIRTFAFVLSVLVAACTSIPSAPVAIPVSQLDAPPRVLERTPILYPAKLGSHLIPSAIVAITILPDGHVADIALVRTTDAAWGQAVVAAVAHWRFTPPRLHGQPVRARLQLPVENRFDEPESGRNPTLN